MIFIARIFQDPERGNCLPCFTCKPDSRGCQFGVLVQKPFTDFRRALGKGGVLPNHELITFHKLAVTYADRKHMDENPGDRVDIQLGKQQQNQYEKNKAALRSIIECIVYLGR